MQNATTDPALTGVVLLGLLLLMSLAGGVFRGLFLALFLNRMLRIALPLSLGAGGVYWLAHTF